MSSRPYPYYDTNYWWLKYFCGLGLPLLLGLIAIYSFKTLHSFCPYDGQSRGIWFVSVYGKQAAAMGLSYLGLALVFFGGCYMQQDIRLNAFYEWITVPGGLLFYTGLGWCVWYYFPVY